MYEVISALAGIGLYFLAFKESTPAAIGLVAGAMVAGIIGFGTGTYVGGRHPNIAAAGPRMWSLVLLSIGSAIAWGVIAGIKPIVSAFGGDSSAGAVVGFVLDAIVAGVIATTAHLSQRVGVEWATKQALELRYGAQVKDYPPGGAAFNDPRRLAYQAAHDETFNDGQAAVDGWGFGARRRRFQLAANNAGQALNPAAACWPRNDGLFGERG